MDSKVVTTLAEDGTALKETRWSPQVLAFAAAGTTTTIGFRGTGTSDDFFGYIGDVELLHQE